MKLFNFPAAKNTSDIVLVLRTASLTGKALDNLRRELRALATAALTLAALAGVATAWSPRDPQHIDAFLKANITQGETVLADFKTYYALRANGSRRRPVHPRRRLATHRSQTPPAPSPGWLKRLIAELREEDYTLTLYRRTS